MDRLTHICTNNHATPTNDDPQVFRSRLPQEAIDVVARMLAYAPERRIRPVESCAHAFFDELRDPATRLPNGKGLPQLLFNFTETELRSAPPGLVAALVPPHARGGGSGDGKEAASASASAAAPGEAGEGGAGGGSGATAASGGGAQQPPAQPPVMRAGGGEVAAGAAGGQS